MSSTNAPKGAKKGKEPEKQSTTVADDVAPSPPDAEAKAAKAAEAEKQKQQRAELQAAVTAFDKKKWDEIARWMQGHRYFERHMRQARLHVRLPGAAQAMTTVRQWVSGKALRKIIASKDFAEKFDLAFTKSQAEILLVAMHNRRTPKTDMAKNFGRVYFLQVARPPASDSKMDMILTKPSADEIIADAPYVWVFQGSIMMRHVMLGGLVVVFLLLCLFPVWPDIMRMGVWYLSVTLLLFFFFFFLARAVIFVVLWIAGYYFWILPNILDDELPPLDSFKPLYSLEPHAKSRSGWMYRISVGIVLFAMTYWVYVQPNAYHAEMLNEQRSFVDDLYSGRFLSDRSEEAASNLDEVVPDYEELLKEELAEAGGSGGGEPVLTEEEQATQDILAEIMKEDEDLYADDDEDGE